MSNLHKDLANDQLHNPKDFAAAANNTKLTKDGSGNLTWASDTGGVANAYMSQNIEGYGNIDEGTEWGLGNGQYNNEHKFTVNLGTPAITTITPKNFVSASVWCQPATGFTLKNWNGWLFGATSVVVLSLLRCKYQCPVPAETPATLDVCRAATVTINLAGNTNPQCFNVDAFTTCEGWDENLAINEMLILTAYVGVGGETTTSFVFNNQIAVATP